MKKFPFLFFSCRDRPGIIAEISEFLFSENLKISNFDHFSEQKNFFAKIELPHKFCREKFRKNFARNCAQKLRGKFEINFFEKKENENFAFKINFFFQKFQEKFKN